MAFEITSVDVQLLKPAGLSSPTTRVSTVGTGAVGFSLAGVKTNDGNKCVIVLEAASALSKSVTKVSSDRTAIIGTTGTDGKYCILTTNGTDLNNWTVLACTDKDKAGQGTTFVAGSGGGGK